MTRRSGLQALLLVAAVFLAYRAGLSGPFLFDDYPNIIHHPLVGIASLDAESLLNAALSNESGPGGRPLAALSFALNYYFAGGEFDAAAFKLVNVAVHALNGLLVLLLFARLVPRLLPGAGAATRGWLPLAIALAWTLHPIQLTSVLYVVQRMASLSATCVLAALLLYAAGRERLRDGRGGGLAMVLASLPLGAGVGFLFKENALLFPLFAFVLEFSAWRGEAATRLGRRALLGLHGLVVGVPAALFALVLLFRPELLADRFGARPFTLVERVLTEARVLFEYVFMLLAPRPQAFSLLHDDVVLSRGLLDPPSTALAVAGWLLLVLAAAVTWWRGARILPFAVGWFLAGHALESTVFPLELMHEHRNYLAGLGVLGGVLLALAALLERLRAEPRLAVSVLLALALVPLPVTLSRAADWGDPERLVVRTVALQPDSARARLMAGQYELATGNPGLAYEQFRLAAGIAPDDLTAVLALQHILARFEQALAAGELPESALESGDVPPPADALAPLRLSPGYVAGLARLLEVETQSRLDDGVPAPGDLNALRRMRRCVESREAACVALAPRLLRWHVSLAERGDVAPGRRAAAAADAGRVLARTGEPALARQWLERAWGLSQKDLQTLVLRGMLEAHMRDEAALRRTRDELAAYDHRPGFRERDLLMLDSLLAELDAERSEPR